MDGLVVANLMRYFRDPKIGSVILRGLQNSDDSFAKNILSRAFTDSGLTNTITDEDVRDLRDFAKSWADNDIKDQLDSPLSGDQQADLRNIMLMNPKTALILGAVQAGSNAIRAAGNVAANDANRLASAVLSANRQNSNRQDDIYGKSNRDKVTEGWAQDKIRRGGNVQTWTNAASDTIDKILGTYKTQERLGRTLDALKEANVPITGGVVQNMVGNASANVY